MTIGARRVDATPVPPTPQKRVPCVSGRVHIICLPPRDGALPTAIVGFLADGRTRGFPFRQFWGRTAVDRILDGLQLDVSERSALRAKLKKDGMEAVIHTTLAESVLKRIGLYQGAL